MNIAQLYTTEAAFSVPESPALVGPVQRVVGVGLHEKPTRWENGYRATGNERYEPLRFGENNPDAAQRLYNFYADFNAAPPEDRPHIDSSLIFVWYVLGKAVKLEAGKVFPIRGKPVRVNRDQLVEGKPYAISTRNHVMPHAIIGSRDPAHNLSLWLGAGIRDRLSPLVVASHKSTLAYSLGRKANSGHIVSIELSQAE